MSVAYPTSSVSITPTSLSPIAAEIWFQFQSAGATFSNFQYYITLNTLQQGTTSVIIEKTFATQVVPPDPNLNGWVNVNEYLNSQIINYLNPSLVEMTADSNSIVRYNISYGIMFNPGLTFSDVFNSSGNLGLSFSNSFVIGSDSLLTSNDIITIEMNNTIINPNYSGTASISSIPSSLSVKTSETYGLIASSPQPGSITNVTRAIGTSSDYWAFNGTRQYDQINLDFTSYQLNGVNGRWISDWGGNPKPIFLNQWETSSLLVPPSNYGYIVALEVGTYDNGTLLATYSISGLTSSIGYEKYTFGVGTANLAAEGISFTNVTQYVIIPILYSGPALAPLIRNVVQCNPSPYNNVQLAWLNTFGDWDFYNFNFKNVYTTDLTRSSFGRLLAPQYNIGDRGTDIYNVNATEGGFISTGFINEIDASILGNLHRALEVYIINGTYSYPIILSDPSFTYKTYLNDKLIEIDFNYTNSYPINIQFN